MALLAGDQLGHFEILGPAGAGGMGEVYKARDMRINRLVAIKVVNEDFSSRFEREARAISGLNHPHICTLYDVGPGYLVMEFVQGETLADLLRRGRLPLEAALRYGNDIADALTAAHAKGVIHRDLKPGNVMVNEDKQLKVLDFGLAKLTDSDQEPDSTVTATGAVMGTPAYMAPEQAKGFRADERSDVFALGAVLYEMATGQRAFRGSSQVDVLHAIVHSTPEPTQPPELQWILDKALAKDPGERYQSAREFGIDLHRLLRRVRSNSSVAPQVIAAAPTARSWTTLIAAATAGFAIPVILWFMGVLGKPANTEPALRHETIISRLTTYGGNERSPAISPDGRYFAFVSHHSGTPDIWVRRVSGGEPIRITHDDGQEGDLVYAPSGESIYFTNQGAIWSVGALGGSLRKVIEQGRSPAPSSDGTELAYVGSDGIYIAMAEGAASRKVIHAGAVTHLSWSPDRAWLAHVEGALFDPHQIFVTDRQGRKKRQVTSFAHGAIGGLAWLPDSGRIVFSRNFHRSQFQSYDLAILRVADGNVRRITLNDSGYLYSVRVSRDGARLITATQKMQREVWKVPLDSDPQTNGSRAVRLLDSSWDPMWIHLSRNTLLFNSGASGNRHLWTMPLDGGAAPRQITSSERSDITHASLSPDESRVAYTSFESGSGQIWLRNLDGSNPMQLTRGARVAFWPIW